MGYETQFDITPVRRNDGPDFDQLVADAKAWRNVSDTSIFNDKHVRRMRAAVEAYDQLTGNQWEVLDYVMGGQSGKFYEWREVLTRLSIAYPDFVFKVTWHGEDAGDYGHAEFSKGKRREAKAVLPPLPEQWT